MSYCRWSTDHGRCDLYCYESADGFWTHVADNKPRRWYLALKWLTDNRIAIPLKDGAIWNMRNGRTWVLNLSIRYRKFTHRKIGLPHDGESFCDSTEQEMFDRVKHLKSLGYNAPNIWEE